MNLSLNPEDPLIKHAFRGSSFAVVRLEELNEITNLKADAVACYRPVNSQELFAVERIALCQQAILRGYRLESGLFTTALDFALSHDGRVFRPMSADLVGDGDIEITRAQNRNFAAAEGFRQMSTESDVWALLTRYQVNADRQYRRAIEDFDRLKRLRPEMPNQPGMEPEPEPVPDLATLTELGYSHLDRPQPITAEPTASRATPKPVPVTTPAPDFTPTAYVRRTTPEPESSRLKIVPIASLFPAPSVPARPQHRTGSGNTRRPACKPATPRANSAPQSGPRANKGSDKIKPITTAGKIDIPAW